MSYERKPFREWAIIELLGHRRLAAYVTEVEVAGAGMLRLDVYGVAPADGTDERPALTQFVNPASVYCLTPTTEAIARGVAAANLPQPVARWELPAPERPEPTLAPFRVEFGDDPLDDDEDDEDGPPLPEIPYD
ncbi:MAG TPA: hypothetical protein VFL91_29810 [Thermomicrobiales bacterium]|nr:hypothetical protein [Thermomicrobiales bacterium]